jgi:hypothetical protein
MPQKTKLHDNLVEELKERLSEKQAKTVLKLIQVGATNALERQLLSQWKIIVKEMQEKLDVDKGAFSQTSLANHLIKAYPEISTSARFVPNEESDNSLHDIVQAYESFCHEHNLERSEPKITTYQNKPAVELTFDSEEQALQFMREKQNELPNGKLVNLETGQFRGGVIDGHLYEDEHDFEHALSASRNLGRSC